MKPDPATLDRVLFGDDEIWEAEEFRSIWWWDLFLTPVGPPEQRALDGVQENDDGERD